MKVYQKLAIHNDAMKNCLNKDNIEWGTKHQQTIQNIIDNYLPHGSGIDSKTELDFKNSSDKNLIFYSSYHAIDDNGMYDRWIDFTIHIIPSLMFGFNMKILGVFGKYDHVKDYLYDIYSECFNNEVEE